MELVLFAVLVLYVLKKFLNFLDSVTEESEKNFVTSPHNIDLLLSQGPETRERVREYAPELVQTWENRK